MPFAGLDRVVDETADLAARFVAADRRIYLVGGIVRDLYLDHPPGPHTDIDLTTDATPEEITAIVEPWADVVWTQGERFGTIGAHTRGRDYEITTHRAEWYDPMSRKPAVRFSTEVEVDLSRRDFTVNAMALSLPDTELFDPYRGADDLHRLVLRTPLEPSVSFDDDPLRMLRAARFAASYRLVPEPEVVGAIARLAPRLDIVSRERVRDELVRLLTLPDPSPGLDLLVSTALLDHVVPGLGAMAADTVDRVVAVPARLPVRLSALLWPLRDAVDEPIAGLRLAKRVASDVRRVLRSAAALTTGDVPRTDGALRRWIRIAGPTATDAIALARAVGAPGELVAWVEERSAELATDEDLDDLGPPLDGAEVMALLGIEAGPDVGVALAWLTELRLDAGPLAPEEVRRRLREWWAAR